GVGVAGLGFAEQLDPADARHALIGHDHRRLQRRELPERLFATARVVQLERLAKRKSEGVQVVWLVVHHEDVVAGPVEVPHRSFYAYYTTACVLSSARFCRSNRARTLTRDDDQRR